MSNVERCPYCGRFMAYEDDAEWGERWVCAAQDAHILADPESWSVLTYTLEGEVDVDGEPISGLVGAHRLTEAQLRIALDLPPAAEVRSTDTTNQEGEAG